MLCCYDRMGIGMRKRQSGRRYCAVCLPNQNAVCLVFARFEYLNSNVLSAVVSANDTNGPSEDDAVLG